MRIDAHQHFWHPSRRAYTWLEVDALTPIRRDFGPEDLNSELERSGLDGSILVQTCAGVDETLEFLEIAARTPFVLGVVGWVDLGDPQVGEMLDRVLNAPGGHSLVGIRHSLQDEPDPMWLLGREVQAGLEALMQRGLSYDLLVRARELPAALQVARAHPGLTFVLDHAAKPDLRAGTLDAWRGSLEPFAALPNMRVKLSGLVTEADWAHWTSAQIVPYLQGCLEIFGPERCLYGSDWPVCLLAADYGQTLELVEAALEGYQDTDRDAVLGESAARAYRLRERGLL